MNNILVLTDILQNMKKSLLFVIMSFISTVCLSQISFEKGYFIDNTDQKVECLIKNLGWKNNPTRFLYKLDEADTEKEKYIYNVKEFSIYDKSKYVRYEVDIDRSSRMLDDLNTDRNPEFKREKLFLKVLVEGGASLYLYEDGSIRRFFYQVDGFDVRQLIYKNYKIGDYKVAENNDYMNQLWNDLKCQDITTQNIKALNYNKGDLVRIFVKYNKCHNGPITNYDGKNKRGSFNLTLRPGIQSATLKMRNNVLKGRFIEFGEQSNLRLGLEAEYVMPFNKNKWSLIIEPTYQWYKAMGSGDRVSAEVDYASIELPIGLRHYVYLNDKSKLFLNALIPFDLSIIRSDVDFDSVRDQEITSSPNLAFGMGYNFNNRYSLEFRYHTRRDVMNKSISYDALYNAWSIVFGYTILN